MLDKRKVNEYRVTRPDLYGLGCPGWGDVSARQGHYIFALNEIDAIRQMREDFPKDSRFDVQLVRRGEEMPEPERIGFAFDLNVAVTFRDGYSSPERTAKLIKTLLESHPDLHHASVEVHRG